MSKIAPLVTRHDMLMRLVYSMAEKLPREIWEEQFFNWCTTDKAYMIRYTRDSMTLGIPYHLIQTYKLDGEIRRLLPEDVHALAVLLLQSWWMNIFPTDWYTSHDDVYQQYAQFEKYISLWLSMLVRDKHLADKSQDYMISLENPLLLLELPIVVFEVRDGEYTGEWRAFSTKEKLNKWCQTPIYSLDEWYIMHNDNRRQFRVLLTELKLDPIEFLKKSKQFKDKTKWEKKNDN